jgi:hypothetical protein
VPTASAMTSSCALRIESHPMIGGSDDRILIAEIAATLRLRGERFTEPRLAVLLVLTRRAGEHLGVDEIFSDVEGIEPNINRSSVYRTQVCQHHPLRPGVDKT